MEPRALRRGYVGLTWPEEYGGGGAPYTHQAIFLEEMARAEAPPHIGVIGIGLAATAVADAYALWATTADPAIVAQREADQRINGIDVDIPYAAAGRDLDSEEPTSILALNIAYADLAAAAGPDTGGFLYNTA